MCKKKPTEDLKQTITTRLTTDDQESLKTGLELARQSYREEIERFYNLEKKAEYPLKFISLSLTILAFLGISNIDYFKSFEGKQSLIVYTSVFLALLATIIGLVCYFQVTRVRRIQLETMNKEAFHGIINQGSKPLISIMIYEYSLAELKYRETNQTKAMYLLGLNICTIVYLVILLFTPFALIII